MTGTARRLLLALPAHGASVPLDQVTDPIPSGAEAAALLRLRELGYVSIIRGQLRLTSTGRRLRRQVQGSDR